MGFASKSLISWNVLLMLFCSIKTSGLWNNNLEKAVDLVACKTGLKKKNSCHLSGDVLWKQAAKILHRKRLVGWFAVHVLFQFHQLSPWPFHQLTLGRAVSSTQFVTLGCHGCSVKFWKEASDSKSSEGEWPCWCG